MNASPALSPTTTSGRHHGHRPASRTQTIQAAADRLLAGTPTCSTGAPSILQLAAEEGVNRRVLTHKHTDSTDDFLARRAAANGMILSPAFRHLEARADDLEERIHRLLAQNRHLEERVQVYAQVIGELLTELELTYTAAPLSKADRKPPGGSRRLVGFTGEDSELRERLVAQPAAFTNAGCR
ncbi:hypothetical protein AB0B30_32205 [Streptomyces narbonensis]|uniref:Uncharacterized protein n=1 Tax=Streptomyces narbonensis TaxID=67333 RepID=A0ABV3CIN8_9ACTN